MGHSLAAGTDAGEPWFWLLTAADVLPPFAMLAVRWSTRVQLDEVGQVGLR